MTSFLNKGFASGLAVLTVASVLLASAAPGSAHDGGAIAAGVIGGLAAGAIIGSAAANAHPAYYPPPPAYDEGGCYFVRRPVFDEYGQVIGHHRVRVCE
jgi:hypothetical protein